MTSPSTPSSNGYAVNCEIERVGGAVGVLIVGSTHALGLAAVAYSGVGGAAAVALAICICGSAAVLMTAELRFESSPTRFGWTPHGAWWIEYRDGHRTTVFLEEHVCFGYDFIALVWRDHIRRRHRMILTRGATRASARRGLAARLKWGSISENTDATDKNFPTEAGSMSVASRRTPE